MWLFSQTRPCSEWYWRRVGLLLFVVQLFSTLSRRLQISFDSAALLLPEAPPSTIPCCSADEAWAWAGAWWRWTVLGQAAAIGHKKQADARRGAVTNGASCHVGEVGALGQRPWPRSESIPTKQSKSRSRCHGLRIQRLLAWGLGHDRPERESAG
ncbi:uncharacterized protein IWZ02DRAFT_440028 [Phyllosticta citriasiana]|uniref:uncharacterized protein n=1 Tax=Phyllosticta citriasiana TaxID=595635 RepID=UPI0030FD63D3